MVVKQFCMQETKQHLASLIILPLAPCTSVPPVLPEREIEHSVVGL